MSVKLLLLLVLTSGLGGYLTGRIFGPLSLLAEATIVVFLVFRMVRKRSGRNTWGAARDLTVSLVTVLGVTFAAATLGVRHFRQEAIASIDECARIVLAVHPELANSTGHTKYSDLPRPWGELQAKKFENGEYWVRFHEKWRTMRRGLVYYQGSTWIRDGKMGSMHAERVRDGWYLFY